MSRHIASHSRHIVSHSRHIASHSRHMNSHSRIMTSRLITRISSMHSRTMVMTSPSFDQTQYGYNQPVSSGKGMAIASMVLGIVSIPAICFWIVGLPCAIVGLILGILYNKKNEHSPMATAGIVCSIITIALLVLVLILYIVGAVSLSSLGYSYYY